MNTSSTPFISTTLFLDKYGDPRTRDWLLMASPLPTLYSCLAYIIIVNFVGPKLMENRKPFNLRKIIIGYNFFQVVFSTWLFYELSSSGWLTGDYSFHCQPADSSTNPKVMRMVNASWWYFFSKFTELPETIFFIMRKKFRQVNVLHIYHHGIMLLGSWLTVKYSPNGHFTFAGLINTFVHMIMYTYYFLSAFGPEVQKYLWWKKYITTMQLVQFVIVIIHAIQGLSQNCNISKFIMCYQISIAVSFYILFLNFYKNTYNKQKLKN